MTRIICGVDVASDKLDARIGMTGASLQVENSAEGIAELLGFCQLHRVELVVMEATGGYEQLPFALLWGAGMACAIVNPRAVRLFAQGMGFLEKTDRIDAGVIAWFAAVKRIVAQPPASENQYRLKALVTRLAQLTIATAAQRNQRRLVSEPTVLASFDEVIAVLRRQARTFEKEIAQLLGSDPLWLALDKTFRTVKGVADRTIARIMAEFPEIGTISNKAAAKLIGLAPLACDSGTFAGRRVIRGGRQGVRDILVLVAGVVRKYDADFAAFDQRLRKAGKAPNAIRVALAHKLIVRLNAKARDVRRTLALTA